MRPLNGLLVLLFLTAPAMGQTLSAPQTLRCESRENPLAIDAAAPRLSWQMRSEKRGAAQSAYRILAASTAAAMAADQGDLWDSGKVNSGETLQIEYAGKPLASHQRVLWKVKLWDGAAESPWSVPADFSMGIVHPADWKAKWIGFPNDDANRVSEAAPCFRKEFAAVKAVARATIHVCGLGQYELTLNGKKVGDSVLAPAWTAYAKTCAYDTYDVTAQVRQGDNALGIMLGNGMYNVLRIPGRYTKFAGSLGVPKAIAQLEIDYADGTHATIGTDASWKTARGPVTFSHAYGGEDYDARLEAPGWDSAGFAGAGWAPAAEVAAPGDGQAALVAAMSPPIKIQKSYPAAKITRQGQNWIIDFGQNLSGWPHLKVSGPAGAAIRMTPAEQLAANGTISQGPSGSPMWFSYTLKGDGVEEWRPRFSYYGFRYLQISGAVPPGQVLASTDAVLPRIVEIASEFTHAAVPIAGRFKSSDDTLNRIHTLINMAILSNTQSVLTDCPHREKLGWLEQSHLVFDGIAMNYDVSALYAKISRDMSDSQTPDGLVPDIAPEYTVFSGGFRDSPEWGSAVAINPWNLYLTYGDQRILREQYDTMKKYVAYLGGKANNDIVAHGLGDWYDIGPKKPGAAQLTSLGLTSTAIYYADIDIVRRAAEVLHRDDDARQYAALGARVRAAFNDKFYDSAAAQYEKGSQTANAMPVALGLAEARHRDALVEKLEESIRAGKYQVSAGDVGFSYVVRALTDSGKGDAMLHMMLQSTGPGYVAQLNKGATTLTEAWDAQASSSQNHLMLGHAEAWLYRGLAGIQHDPDAGPAGLAFRRFFIRPQIAGTLASASAEYDSPRGLIRSAWERDGKKLTLTVTIPPNTTATIFVPAAGAEAVTESGKPAKNAPGLAFNAWENNEARFTAGSGTYVLETTLP